MGIRPYNVPPLSVAGRFRVRVTIAEPRQDALHRRRRHVADGLLGALFVIFPSPEFNHGAGGR